MQVLHNTICLAILCQIFPMLRHLIIGAIGLLALQSPKAQAVKTAKTAVLHYNEGIRLKDQKKYADALLSFKKAISLNDRYKEAFYDAGWCSVELKKYTEALGYLQKAKILWPDEPKIYLEIGYANENVNKIADAKNNYDKCISLKTDYALAYKYLGYLFYDEKNYEEAVKNFESFIRYEPNITSDEIFYKKGFSENELGRYNDAIISLTQASRIYAEDAGCYTELGYAYTKLENADEALVNYRKAVELSPASAVGYNGMGDVYKDIKKDAAEALKHYLKALEINPDNKKANYCIGWCYNDLDKYTEAVPYLKKAIEIDSRYVSAITELGYSDYALEHYDDALAQFKKAINIDKTELAVYYSGLCYVGLKQKPDAVKMYNDLKGMSSDYADKLRKKINDL